MSDDDNAGLASAVRQRAAQLTERALNSRDKGRWRYRLRSEAERGAAAAPANSLALDSGSAREFVWELILRYLEENGDDPTRWFTAFELVQFDPQAFVDKFGSESVSLRTLSSILSDMCLKKQILERTERRSAALQREERT